MNFNLSKKYFLILAFFLVVIVLAGFLVFYFQKKAPAPTSIIQPGNQNVNQVNTNTATTSLILLPPLDSDHDGSSDEEEKTRGTDPQVMDTDKDGIIDGAEGGKFFKTDPLNPDTDGDGYKDGEEVLKGYDPTKKDAKIPAGPPPGSVGSKP